MTNFFPFSSVSIGDSWVVRNKISKIKCMCECKYGNIILTSMFGIMHPSQKKTKKPKNKEYISLAMYTYLTLMVKVQIKLAYFMHAHTHMYIIDLKITFLISFSGMLELSFCRSAEWQNRVIASFLFSGFKLYLKFLNLGKAVLEVTIIL